MTKKKRSYTLTDQADELLNLIADALGVSKSAVLELAIREKAANLNIVLDSSRIRIKIVEDNG